MNGLKPATILLKMNKIFKSLYKKKGRYFNLYYSRYVGPLKITL